jgi:hypothetical protein
MAAFLTIVSMEDYPSRKVPNPWSDLCTVNGDKYGLLGAKCLIFAMQWGAPSSKLTPEARQLLDEYFGLSRKEGEARSKGRKGIAPLSF